MSFGEHITALTRSCYYHLRQLWVVSRSLSSSSASTLVHAFIALLSTVESLKFDCSL